MQGFGLFRQAAANLTLLSTEPHQRGYFFGSQGFEHDFQHLTSAQLAVEDLDDGQFFGQVIAVLADGFTLDINKSQGFGGRPHILLNEQLELNLWVGRSISRLHPLDKTLQVLVDGQACDAVIEQCRRRALVDVHLTQFSVVDIASMQHLFNRFTVDGAKGGVQAPEQGVFIPVGKLFCRVFPGTIVVMRQFGPVGCWLRWMKQSIRLFAGFFDAVVLVFQFQVIAAHVVIQALRIGFKRRGQADVMFEGGDIGFPKHGFPLFLAKDRHFLNQRDRFYRQRAGEIRG